MRSVPILFLLLYYYFRNFPCPLPVPQVGLVTSNARHNSSGATLPHLNFCIAAPQLRPLLAWAQQQQHVVAPGMRVPGQHGAAIEVGMPSSAAVAAAAGGLGELQRLDQRDMEADRCVHVWPG